MEWYDTKEGIESHLSSLEDFKELLRARYDAHYDKGEKLNEFCIYGMIWLDNNGNLMHPQPERRIPDVLTRGEYLSIYECQGIVMKRYYSDVDIASRLNLE